MKRVLVTGAGGMTGSEVSARATLAGWTVRALARAEADIRDVAALGSAAREFQPDLLINCAAYTAVDRAELEPGLATAVNTDGARNVARLAAARAIPVVHISSDYVFSGDARVPYRPDAAPAPTGVYGMTKLAGEIAVTEETADYVTVRTSWVFSHRGSNFVRTILRLAAERHELRVVDDQLGRPTSAGDLAEALLAAGESLLENPSLRGTYHFANAGETSWFEFAEEIVAEGWRGGERMRPRIIPIATRDFPTAARRPAYSVLDTSSFTSTFGVVPRPWRDALLDSLALM